MEQSIAESKDETTRAPSSSAAPVLVKVQFKVGQKFPTPPPGAGDRVFYETLLEQNPDSEMAQDWCLAYGVLPDDKAAQLNKVVNNRKSKPLGSNRPAVASPVKAKSSSTNNSSKHPSSSANNSSSGGVKRKSNVILDDDAIGADTGILYTALYCLWRSLNISDRIALDFTKIVVCFNYACLY